jgi:acyl carrier protein
MDAIMAPSEAQLRALVATISKMPPEKITPAARFTVELRMDSLASLDLLAALEEDHGITISQAEARKLQTFGELVAHVTARSP